MELYGYTWKEYSIKERVRENIISSILCLSREIRVYGLRWVNPFGLSGREKNELVQRMFLEDVSMDISSDSVSITDSDTYSSEGVTILDSDSEMFTDSE